MLRHLTRNGRRAVAALTVTTLSVALPIAALPLHAASPTTQTPVMGPSLLSAAQLAAWYHHNHSAAANLPALHNDVQALAQIFIDEGRIYNVRGDIAFTQSMLETGWLSFPSNGQIPATFNNYAGLFAFNNRAHGTTCAAETSPSRCFATPTIGVQYQIQLLRGYADPASVNMPMLIRPPSGRIGVAPYWERFGGQQSPLVWASAPNYGAYILGMYAGALSYNGFNMSCLPFYTGGSGRTSGTGYWVIGSNGAAFAYGTAPNYGNVANLHLRGPIVSAESTPDHHGYWMLGYDGGVFSFGSARFKGSLGGVALWAPVNDFAATPDGQGYWLAAYDGGVFTFGSARFFGSLGGVHLKSQVVGIESTRSGQGYWLLEKNGTVHTFGDAHLYGTPPSTRPLIELTRTVSGHGYYTLRDDGTVYAFGDAHLYGNAAGCGMGTASHMLVTPSGAGYWILTQTGAVLSFGDARPLGMPSLTTSGISGFALQN
jgi:hypothetical protein